MSVTDKDEFKEGLSHTLNKISARETTVGDVNVKVNQLINELENGSVEGVVKKLIRDEVKQQQEAKKWKKLAVSAICGGMVLLACVFGLMVLSLQLSKDTYVAEDQPMLTSNAGEVVQTANAQQTYALESVPALPVDMLKTVTEITYTDWYTNITTSTEIIGRSMLSVGTLFHSVQGYFILVSSGGFTQYIGRSSTTFQNSEPIEILPDEVKQFLKTITRLEDYAELTVVGICGSSKCARFSATDPTPKELKDTMERRLKSETQYWDDAGKSRFHERQLFGVCCPSGCPPRRRKN